ncbi:PepSY domain-containing protein [Comamonas sp.]|uniref:PepSY domain-containing protein n=1 Tax=Comamonas sp. TaxID=34028 RepID=UPI002FC882E2
MRLHPKRWLYLTHRWLGIALCAFFAMWFVSGMVMMYVGYPKLTPAERLAHLPALDAAAPLLSPAQALERAGVGGALKDLRLAASSGGRPVYFATPAGARGGDVVVIDALHGEHLPPVDASWALASAAAYAGSSQGLAYLGSVDEDAFTHSRGLDAHRPLHRVQLADADHSWLYVSGQTGEVVRDATRTERLWNYAGAWIHWLYPFRGNAFNAYWSDIVNWLSVAGIGVALAGTAVGIMRWRFTRPYRSGARSPYPGRMMRWHHVSGLLFALITITWIFSGLMSMNPWRIFDSGAAPLQTTALQGGPLVLTAQHATPQALIGAAGGPVRELRWQMVLGRPTAFAQAASGAAQLFDAGTARPLALDPAALKTAATQLIAAPVARIDTLTDYDLYYYARAPHSMMGASERPLPIWRIVFDDTHASWVHLDPHTGNVLGRLDSHKRASRWLFAMLHSWDWLPLLERRPLWDITLLTLSLGGLLLSGSGMVIGWRRLRRRQG